MSWVYEEKSNCCGCTACVNICIKNAIAMAQDEKGFYYPKIDETKCVHCNLCREVCDFVNFIKVEDSNSTKSYAVRHKKDDELMSSRSGGFASALAESVILRGGVCYGAALDSDLNVVHKKAVTYEECLSFKGSKYVQSRIKEHIFREIKGILDSGQEVLFSGTGCQVHGLLSYLEHTKTNQAKLITVDFVCHGVPSPEVWSKYKKEIELRNNKEMTRIIFRDKVRFGWTSHVETYLFEDGSIESNSRWADVYYQHCMFRDSCYKCPYTTPYRKADFTIGDYWGFEKTVSGYRDNKGLSLVITHNKRADEILSELNDKVYIEATDLAMSMQNQLRNPAYKGLEYRRFWKKWSKDKRKAVKEFFFPTISRKLYLRLLKKMKKVIKIMINLSK